MSVRDEVADAIAAVRSDPHRWWDDGDMADAACAVFAAKLREALSDPDPRIAIARASRLLASLESKQGEP